MKIAVFASNFPKTENEEIYGKSIGAYNLFSNLAKMGHEVHIFTLSKDSKYYESVFDSIIIHSYPSLINYRSEGISFEILYKPLSYDFDIVHLRSGISFALLAGYIYCKMNKKPFLISWHGDSIKESKYNRYVGLIPSLAARAYKTLINSILKDANCIVSVSKQYINESLFLKKFKNKTCYIPNGIDLSKFDLNSTKESCKEKLRLNNKKIVLFVGSIHELKGVDVLIEAIPRIINYDKDILFVFAGGGSIEKYIEIAKKRKLLEYVRFVGYIGCNKSLYFRSSDVFVLPSFIECFPNVLLEAMAFNLPIVATRVGGVPELVIDGNNGLLVPAGDFEAMANAIMNLLSDKEAREKMGINGRHYIENFSWSDIAKRYDKLYKRLVHNQAN